MGLALDLGLAALLYSCLIVYLFSIFTDQQRVMLIAFTAAFIATGGWMFASLPLAGLLWVLFLCGGLALGYTLLFWDSYALLAWMTAFYGLFLSATVLVASKKFLAGLVAETEIERQRQVVALLLNDFEEKASDWLWETDEAGFLRHVSARLVEATASNANDLLLNPFAIVISKLVCSSTPKHAEMWNKLHHHLKQQAHFSEVILPVKVNGKTLWWSFSAKPLLNEYAGFIGWRGVTADISAAYEREQEMVRLANIDSLTGLANRYHFNSTYFSIKKSTKPCILLMLDLDNFKGVNDSLGHIAGDALLCETARRLLSVAPPNSVLTRLCGDEFASKAWARWC